MAYRLSGKAEDDILDIYLSGTAEFGVAQAERYHDGLAKAFTFLSEFPCAARERSELSGTSRAYPYDRT